MRQPKKKKKERPDVPLHGDPDFAHDRIIPTLLGLTKLMNACSTQGFAYFPSLAMAPQDPPFDPLSFVGMRFLLAAFAVHLR